MHCQCITPISITITPISIAITPVAPFVSLNGVNDDGASWSWHFEVCGHSRGGLSHGGVDGLVAGVEEVYHPLYNVFEMHSSE